MAKKKTQSGQVYEIFVTNYSMDYYTYNYTTTTDFDGENALTNAIHYVSMDDMPRVYTLTGHGEMEIPSSVTEMIKQDNMETQPLSLLMIDEVPEDASALVLHAPSEDLTADEADKLIRYLENGGNIVLISNYIETGSMENLLRVTQKMGLTAGEGLIVEGDRNMHMSRFPYYLLPDLSPHAITQPLADKYYVLTTLAQPIMETGEGEAVVTALLETSSSAYSKMAGLEMETTAKEDGDTDGPFIVAAASELNEGKLVWVSSADLLNESIDTMVSGANSDLFMNSLSWMSDQVETIAIRAKSLDSVGLTLTQAQNSFWSIVLLGLIPGAVIVMGIMVVMRRKRR